MLAILEWERHASPGTLRLVNSHDHFDGPPRVAHIANGLTIFFDRAKNEDPQAPKGLTCAAKFVR